jgi:hypothetical protein
MHNEFAVNILEGAISGKKAVERPRLRYLKQVARNTGADSYTGMKRMACNSSRWKAANRSKDCTIRRRLLILYDYKMILILINIYNLTIGIARSICFNTRGSLKMAAVCI